MSPNNSNNNKLPSTLRLTHERVFDSQNDGYGRARYHAYLCYDRRHEIGRRDVVDEIE